MRQTTKWIGFLLLMFLFPLLGVSAEWKAPEGMKVVWSDEFDGPGINTNYWKYETKANGWSQSWNNEHQDYTDNGVKGPNAFISNGNLVILAKKVNDQRTFNSYTSARIVTAGLKSFQYGYIAARIRMPYGNGIWPAFWMLGTNIDRVPWPTCGEIDIVEMIGGKIGEQYGGGDGKVSGALHGPGYSGARPKQGFTTLESGRLADAFHVYAVKWNKEAIEWYFDDQMYLKVKRTDVGRWVFDAEFYILLNLAVGGNWGKYPDETTVFPQSMTVDWVRVYQ